jgi:uncharacterized membrane protein YeaQ/YmgE (transglycosylase-associated protein family)
MSLIGYIIILAVSGLIVGALARLLLPGPDPIGIGMTILVGLLGTFSAGMFSWYVLHRHGAGLLLSIAFSMLILYLFRRTRGTRYGPPR